MLDPEFLKPRSHWLAFVASFLIIATVVGSTLFWSVGSVASSSKVLDVPLLVSELYQSPQRCRECHEDEFQAWSTTTHADASFDPIFQTYLQRAQEPGECFSCHATGYDTKTGQFVLAGVTCEACHGPYRPGHPEESMTIARSEDLCGACHTSTLIEWEASRHGEVGVTCVACHEVHTQKTRAADATNSLCAGCHQERTRDSIHDTHTQLDVQCIECHLARPAQNLDNAVNGHAATGHSFAVVVRACNDCHQASSLPTIEP